MLPYASRTPSPAKVAKVGTSGCVGVRNEIDVAMATAAPGDRYCGPRPSNTGSDGTVVVQMQPLEGRLRRCWTPQEKYDMTMHRLETFLDIWPLSHVVAPEKLAAAGFFYTGQADVVKCFACGGTLCDSRWFHRPWLEHAYYYPSCDYVLAEKGDWYVFFVTDFLQRNYYPRNHAIF